MESNPLFAKVRSRLLFLSQTDSFFTSPVGILVFGPSASAARMEGSKAFSKDFMQRHSIPTADFKTFTASQYTEALEYTKTCGHRVVLKASGLAAGKGVLIPETPEETAAGLKDILLDQVFGSAGESLRHPLARVQ